MLAEYVAGSLDQGTRALLETHLIGCAECVEYVRSYRETIRLARTTAAEETVGEMPAALVEAILVATRGRGSQE